MTNDHKIRAKSVVEAAFPSLVALSAVTVALVVDGRFPATLADKFVPLGGSGEIGMNLNLYGYDDQWVMLDLGDAFQPLQSPFNHVVDKPR